MESTRGEMELRLEEIERAREEDRLKMDAVLETVQQLSNSLQALEQVPETPGRPIRRNPYRRDGGYDGSYYPRRHSGRNNSGQFRRSEPYRRHDRHNFLESHDDAIKGQMEELIKTMDNILQTVRQLRNSFQSFQGIPKIVQEPHNTVQEINGRDPGSVSGYARHHHAYVNSEQNNDWDETEACFDGDSNYGQYSYPNVQEECWRKLETHVIEGNSTKEILKQSGLEIDSVANQEFGLEIDSIENQESRWVVKTTKGSKTPKQPWSKQKETKKRIPREETETDALLRHQKCDGGYWHKPVCYARHSDNFGWGPGHYYRYRDQYWCHIMNRAETPWKNSDGRVDMEGNYVHHHNPRNREDRLSFKQWDPGKFIVHLEDKVKV